MGIEVKTDSYGEIEAILINGIQLKTEDEISWYVPKSLLMGCFVEEMPDNVIFDICVSYEEDFVSVDTEPYSIRRLGPNKIQISFSSSGSKQHWNGNIDFEQYMISKRELIKKREKEQGDIIERFPRTLVRGGLFLSLPGGLGG